MADREFLIKEMFPVVRRRKKQLTAFEIEHTRSFENVRIHVERIIGLQRQKFKTFCDIIPLLIVKYKQDEFQLFVCCLINLIPTIVPFI